MSRPFHFKKFSIHQDNAAMKVGTDAVLLGAWASHDAPQTILDIGCGTGLLSLMLAQRYTMAKIDAIDIDSSAIMDSQLNFHNAPWTERLSLSNEDIFELTTRKTYDLIICNPPFFEKDSQALGKSRVNARQGIHFSILALFQKTKKLLKDKAVFCLVYPKAEWEMMADEVEKMGWKLQEICYLHPTPDKESHRVLLQLGMEAKACESSHLVMELSRHVYSEEYKALTKDFYLK